MGNITTASFAKALWPGVNKFFQTSYNEYAPEYSEIFDMESSGQSYEEDVGFAGMGLAPIKTEANSIQYDDMEQGFTTRYTNFMVALGYIISYEMMKDNLYPALLKIGNKKSRHLAFSMRQTKEVIAANILNRAFNSDFVSGDDSELCAVDHPRKTSSSTWSNMLSVAADLSEAAVEQICINIAKFTDEAGLTIRILPTKLIIPPDLMFTAERILKSVLQNDTANNAINALKSKGIIPAVAVNHYLTGTKRYFVKTNCPDGLKHFERESVVFASDNDTDTLNLKYKAFERYVFGWSDPRAIYGVNKT